MGFAAKPSDFKGAGFFKPADHANALGIVFEPKSITKNVPSTYNGQTRERDEVVCDVAVFNDTLAVETGVPSVELKGVKVTHGYITEKLERVLPDGAIPGRITKTQTKSGGSAWNLDDVAADVSEAMEKWYDDREAAVAAAVADAPDFED